ncbi:ATP-dependent helicase/nuclease subunit A [Rhodoligotrophos appendicifer]|uniref:double-strand break repair helicase AddA n=1 Tax=Rhodoligotrophos appendicifer TaxID=987056 RepID=UPI001479219F|nr:double-strand break repair helicase AddA [Rhodoligotrophos appendicifer]
MSDAASTASALQSRASNPAVSAWVSASAGSGKTRVLVDRVIRLLLGGTEPARILCLTFTRAAAGEMSNRLFAVLSGWIGLEDAALIQKITELTGTVPRASELSAARRLFTRALETPGGLKIQTIHAFCEKLLQRFPVEAGIVPGFSVMDERSADEVISTVRDEFLRKMALDPRSLQAQAFDTVSSYVNELSFDRILKEILDQRRQLVELLEPRSFQEALARLRIFFDLQEDTTLGSIAREACNGADRSQLAAAMELLAGAGTRMEAQSARIDAFLKAADDDAAFAAAKDIFCKSDGGPRADAYVISTSLAAKNPGVADALFAERDRILRLCEQERAMHVVTATEALLIVALSMLGAYEHQKRQQGQYDYDDLIDQTLSMLSRMHGAAWVLFKLDGGIDHILIDEAQDTSPVQWQIVEKIAEEFFAGSGARGDVARTLFVVGDHKQSIYSFQGADPQAFDDMHRAFRSRIHAASRLFEDVPLSVSFRSTADVLRAVDWVFAQVGAQAGLIPFGGELRPHEPTRRGHAGLVEIWSKEIPLPKAPRPIWDAPVDHEDAGHPRLRLAEKISATISGWLQEGSMLEAHGRPIRPGDIMILVRRRDRFVDALLRSLKRRGVPVAGADRLVLTEHIAIMDLIALGRFVLLPEDDLTLACVLKSPLLARDDGNPIDDDDLIDLCHSRAGTLWTSLNSGVNKGLPYAAALNRLRGWFNKVDFKPPFTFFSEILGADGGRRNFVRRLGAEVNDPLDEFLRLTLEYEQAHTPSLQGFLHWLTSAETSIKRDMEHGSDEVRIMTVHGAKGLEANIVFLPDTCSPPRKQNDPAILFSPHDSRGAGIPFWRLTTDYQGSAIESLREREQEAQRQEYNRLLYVAMTRARDRLYVCGYDSVRKASGVTWYDMIFEALAPNAEELPQADGSTIWRIQSKQTAEISSAAKDVICDIPGSLPQWLHTPPPSESEVKPLLATSLASTDGEDDVPLSPLAGMADSARLTRGRLIHKLLEALPELSLTARETAARKFLAHPAHKLREDQQNNIWEEVSAILEDTRFAAVFAPGSLAEVPLAGFSRDDGVKLVGRIDRLAVTDDEVLIVDYKTNQSPPLSQNEVPEAYRRQLGIYAELAGRIFPSRHVRCALLWTYGPHLMEVSS